MFKFLFIITHENNSYFRYRVGLPPKSSVVTQSPTSSIDWIDLSLDDVEHFYEYINEITAARYSGEVAEDRAKELREVVAKFYYEIGFHAARGEQEEVTAKQKEYSDWFTTLPDNEKGFAVREVQRLQEIDAKTLREEAETLK